MHLQDIASKNAVFMKRKKCGKAEANKGKSKSLSTRVKGRYRLEAYSLTRSQAHYETKVSAVTFSMSATKKAQHRQAQTHLFSALVESCSGQVEALCLC